MSGRGPTPGGIQAIQLAYYLQNPGDWARCFSRGRISGGLQRRYL